MLSQTRLGPAILLTPQETGRVWRRIVLTLAEPEGRLENEAGDVLAIASNLIALLDAVDGGVAEAPGTTLDRSAQAGSLAA